jgi:hypothetical protein
MTLRIDMFDINKKRVGVITEDYKKLTVNFQFRSGVLLLPSEKKSIVKKNTTIMSRDLGGKIKFRYDLEEKEFIFKFEQKKKDLNYLYKIFLVLAFGIGENISLTYFLKDFPYYPTTRYFNIVNHAPEWIRFRKELVTNPEPFILNGLNLLADDESFFQELIPILIEINALSLSDVVFAAEYGILEHLASRIRKRGNIFRKDSEEYGDLKKFQEEILDNLSHNFSRINNEPLQKKFALSTLNNKYVTKEKIYEFLDSFDNGRISKAKEHVTTWNKMRNKTLVHGCYGSRVKFFSQNKSLARELHDVLIAILAEEYWNRLYRDNE